VVAVALSQEDATLELEETFNRIRAAVGGGALPPSFDLRFHSCKDRHRYSCMSTRGLTCVLRYVNIVALHVCYKGISQHTCKATISS